LVDILAIRGRWYSGRYGRRAPPGAGSP
jgi:hypothetical protein